MRLPSKVTPYKDSTLARLPAILKELKKRDRTVLGLFETVEKRMSASEYIDALDCLFALGKITLNGEVLHYADGNLL